MQKIRIDFDNPGLPQHISAVENDSQSRFFQATLYENGKAYTAPEGATYSIMYRGFGPQNQGWYDTINDGAGKRAACAVSGNVVTCEIARQALQVPGHVSIVLCVTTGKGYMLKSWPIECDCKNDRYDSTAEIQSFFYATQVSNADWNRILQALEDLKNTIDPTLSVSGKAADAAKVGEAVGQVKEDIVKVDHVVFIELSGEEVNGYDFYPQSNTFYENSTYSIKRYEIIDGETYYLDSKRNYALGNNKNVPSLYEEFIDAEDSPGYFTNTKGYKYLFVRSKKNSVNLEVKVFTNALKKLDSRIESVDGKTDALSVYSNIANPIYKIDNYVWLSVDSKYGADGWSCIAVKVDENKVYTCDLINEAFSWFVDKNGNSLGEITTNKFTTPAGCVKIQISKQNTDNFVVLNADVLDDLTYSKYPYGKYFSKVSDTVQEIVSNSYVSVSMFENIGIIGDSFASGGIYGKDGVPDGAYYGLSWCSVLGRKTGVNINNYSAPGLSTRTWLTNKLSEALSDSGSNLYLMCLGINDSTTVTTGTVDDIKADYTQNPDTFYGNYGKIFEQLKAHSPNAKFIFIVPPESTSGEIASAIQKIAEHYSVPSFKSVDDEYFNSSFYFDNHSNGHPIGISYAGMANAYERLICKCIIENKDYFASYHT